MGFGLEWSRLWAMFVKELIQMRRDRLTFAIMIGVPLIQLVLFGFAINSDPKNLPMALLSRENNEFTRSLIAALENTRYFKMVMEATSEREAERLLATGEVQFVLTIPVDFKRKLMRGERPSVLVEADATDPIASSNPIAVLAQVIPHVLEPVMQGTLATNKVPPPPLDLRVHRRYNPEGITAYNIVPGLMGVILTMTMVMMTGVAITREQERGTMENLLATPVLPVEVILGKIMPYILIGYLQVGIILTALVAVFHVPIAGNLLLLLCIVFVFITANLMMGILFSTIARNQMQAMQMTFFFFLPSLLLSGFMFPFRGMPRWAQTLGEFLPLTHFLRVVRGILLKGNPLSYVFTDVWPLLLFTLVVMAVALKRYRLTLD